MSGDDGFDPAEDPVAAIRLPEGFVLARTSAEGVQDGARSMDGADDSVLELRRTGDRAGTGVRCDLARISLRGGASEARAMPVVKAVGESQVVVDATAGLLGDAFLLAAAGLRVIAIERSPVVHALAADGLRRALLDARTASLIDGRIELVLGDAREWLARRTGTAEAPDAVVIDPMFPPKRKRSALPRKEMVVLREVVGSDFDAAELLDAARKCARMRVALKRGDDAEEIVRAEWRVGGTTVRYDVWGGALGR